MIGLFVVFEEGGLYVPLPLKGWISAVRSGVPIIGAGVGRHRYVYDRIMRRHGYWPIRRVIWSLQEQRRMAA